MTAAPTLELRGIRKSFGTTPVIHGVDLQIQDGEFVVFVGPSGCGKSTLLRLIAGLEDPTDGDVLINGNRVNDVPSAARGLSMVFQSYALYPHMSVRRNLTFGLENTRTPREEIDRRMRDAAALLQIEELLDRRPGQLSGGQRQRVAIGRAIVREPVVFLFDEPLSNLDAELRMQMRVEISNLHADLGNTMIYVTHDQIEAMTMADRIVVLRDGLVAQVGRPLDLYNQPANKFVAGFIGSPRMNFLDGQITTASETMLSLDCGHSLAIHPTKPQIDRSVSVGIRPEDIEVSTDGTEDITVRVNNFEQLGSMTYIYTQLANGENLTVQLPHQVPLERNQELPISFPSSSIHVFGNDDEKAVELEA